METVLLDTKPKSNTAREHSTELESEMDISRPFLEPNSNFLRGMYSISRIALLTTARTLMNHTSKHSF